MKKLVVFAMMVLLVGLAGCSDADHGMLKISSDPGDAEIYIDGDRKGNTPAKKGQTFAIKLSEGEHTIEIIKPISNSDQYDQYFGKKTVFVAEKSLQSVSIPLKRGQSQALKEKLERERQALQEKLEREKQALQEKLQAACDAVSDYKVNGNATVTDKVTGLIWKQCPEGLSGGSCENGEAKTYTWDESEKSLSFAGYSDWRLPSKDELLSIAHKECGSPTINSLVFPSNGDGWYWSASAGNASGAWAVGFNLGFDYVHHKSSNLYVRLVRGGL